MQDGSATNGIDHDQAMEMVSSPDVAVRAKLASHSDIPPEMLYFLAGDEELEVRIAVAANKFAPKQTDILLARDTHPQVRKVLAGKVVNDPSSNEILKVLAEDQMVVVRAALAEALKDISDAPSDVIMTLALDTKIDVAAPILEFSPVLTDQDLIVIIEKGPVKGGLNNISRRKGVTERVSDAIIGSDDLEAIGELLGNNSAQIREEALDDLVDRASNIELWHAPLVGRSTISASSAKKMALFLADNLMKILQDRSDLPSETLSILRESVHDKLGQPAVSEGQSGDINDEPQNFLESPLPLEHVRMLYNSNALGVNVVNEALKAADYLFVFSALVVLSDLDVKVCRVVFEQSNAKGILSVCHAAYLPIGLAVTIQQKMAKVSPSEVLREEEPGKYPLSEEDMSWCLDFFKVIASKR